MKWPSPNYPHSEHDRAGCQDDHIECSVAPNARLVGAKDEIVATRIPAAMKMTRPPRHVYIAAARQTNRWLALIVRRMPTVDVLAKVAQGHTEASGAVPSNGARTSRPRSLGLGHADSSTEGCTYLRRQSYLFPRTVISPTDYFFQIFNLRCRGCNGSQALSRFPASTRPCHRRLSFRNAMSS